MVLTNFECWSHNLRRDDVTVNNVQDQSERPVVSYISTNGYYGYGINNNNNNNNHHHTDNSAESTPNSIGHKRCKRPYANVSQQPSLETSKRVRLVNTTDDFSAAQYCNDFFLLQSTQMDTEDHCCHQQQQMDEFVTTTCPENTISFQSNIHYLPQQTYPVQLQPDSETHLEAQGERQMQKHYQSHLHRANRDVSRCLLSHMI